MIWWQSAALTSSPPVVLVQCGLVRGAPKATRRKTARRRVRRIMVSRTSRLIGSGRGWRALVGVQIAGRDSALVIGDRPASPSHGIWDSIYLVLCRYVILVFRMARHGEIMTLVSTGSKEKGQQDKTKVTSASWPNIVPPHELICHKAVLGWLWERKNLDHKPLQQ